MSDDPKQTRFEDDLKEALYLLGLFGIARGHCGWAKHYEDVKQRLREHLHDE